jgi:hypothetical protein
MARPVEASGRGQRRKRLHAGASNLSNCLSRSERGLECRQDRQIFQAPGGALRADDSLQRQHRQYDFVYLDVACSLVLDLEAREPTRVGTTSRRSPSAPPPSDGGILSPTTRYRTDSSFRLKKNRRSAGVRAMSTMTESTAQSLRRRPFEVSKRMAYVAYVQIRPVRDDCVSTLPQRLYAFGPGPLLQRQLDALHCSHFRACRHARQSLVYCVFSEIPAHATPPRLSCTRAHTRETLASFGA